ncbi:colicin-like pore-forming protein [Serratia fonticola]|uniref:colicin-like pore-forming protein n=1 Tax=Serratia fonticola TaxID=47917 RepID=UPI000E2DEEA3|nr:colicin-like pore-forming protein [Serratia fonticola]RDL26467.1 colicin pore forming domain-containing protein [Serratia fonticola]
MMARYEDTTQYERDVLTSMGYYWNGHGWQRGFDLSDGNMVVEAWSGNRLPERQKEISNITHLWDQKISDINKPISAFDPEDDDVVPFSNEAKESFRQDSDKAIEFAANKVKDLDNQIKEMQQDIDELNGQLAKNNQTILEKANLNAIISKLKVSKERLTVLRHEANKRRVQQEYLKRNNEDWFYSREKPTPWVREQQSLNRKEMGKTLEQVKTIQADIDAAKQKLEQLEHEQRQKENEVNRLKDLDLTTEAGLLRTENDARQNEQTAQNALNDANGRINQAANDKAIAENSARDYEFKAAQAEAKRKKHDDLLDNFVKWNTEVDYGKQAWWTEFNGAMDLISNLTRERDTAINQMNAARESANRAANRLEQAKKDKANAENVLNNARKTLSDVQTQKQANTKAKQEAETKAEEDRVKDAVKYTANFYTELTGRFGEQSAKIAQELADAAKGKQIRSADEALRAFNKYKDVLNKKFSVKDREAIAKALESLNRDQMAKSLAKFSKAFNYVGWTIVGYDTVKEIENALDSNNWRPVFVQLESLAAGRAATALTAFAFSVILGSPLGVLGYAIIMTLVSAFIDDSLMEKVNKLIGI